MKMKKPKGDAVCSIFVAAAVILIAGFSYAGQTTEDTNKITAKDVKKQAMETIQAVKGYSYQQRDKAMKEVKGAMDDLDNSIDRMQARIQDNWEKMSAASKEKAKETLKELREQRNKLSEWYGELKQSSAGAWDHIKDGFVKGYESLVNSFEKAENEFSSH